MIDSIQNLILIDNRIKTAEIESCDCNHNICKYTIVFRSSSKVYVYGSDRVDWLKHPDQLDPTAYRLLHKGRQLSNIVAISVFTHRANTYWHIRFCNGKEYDYNGRELVVVKSCLSDDGSKNVFQYLKQVAAENALSADDGTKLLSKQYEKIDFIPDSRAVACYLAPKHFKQQMAPAKSLIFPFGCNASQQKAVRTAFESQISVIQGPPGTGKTQTILNIIANILIAGKTVLVVSNNNSATANVLEKLSEYNLGFLAATLGNTNNKQHFTETQAEDKCYPDEIASWLATEANNPTFIDAINQLSEELGDIFAKQERLSLARQELQALDIEWQHYRQEIGDSAPTIKLHQRFRSSKLIQLWQEYLRYTEEYHLPRWRILARLIQKSRWIAFRLKNRIACNANDEFYRQEPSVIISAFRILFYKTRLVELHTEIENIETFLAKKDAKSLMASLSEKSMVCLKNSLYHKYGRNESRPIFPLATLKNCCQAFLQEYPIVLSTTFSARTSLHEEVEYDYLIIDEASQVSIETGALALSCARNAVIVGDSMQLPNVVTEQDKHKLNAITQQFHLSEGYDCATNSFLESVCKIIPNMPQTLLREHYRCHPKIINFCNQKFYGGNLVCMTQDHGEPNVLSAVKSVNGNHARNHMNQREIDVIKNEVLPSLAYDDKDIGIIAPYNNQIDAIKRDVGERIDIATVHKFQGREKDAIIMTTVDDTITAFSDDPNLLNVAISRAKQRFCLVVSGNKQPENCNINDLIAYIEYNNCSVTQSKIHSIFDYLYKQYTDIRIVYLKKHKRISEYDSENLTYALIEDILEKTDKLTP